MKSSNLQYLEFGTNIFPVRLIPLSRSSEPFSLKSPSLKSPRHFIMSSSIPPAVVTITSTSLCFAKNLKMSLSPDVTMFDVYPR